MKRVVIVGAGYAGLLTAKNLMKKFGKSKDIEISLIDRHPFHTVQTGLHEVAAGRVDEETIRVSLKKIFDGQAINLIMDTVLAVDFDRKRVLGELENYEYDYLVLAAGREPQFEGVQGAEDFCHTLWSYEDAVKLYHTVHERFRSAVTQTDLAEKKRLLTFYIVGAGVCGAEMAGELAEYIPVLCKNYEIEESLVSLCCIDSAGQVLSGSSGKIAERVHYRLNKMGVSLMLNTKVWSVGKDYIELQKAGGEKTKKEAGVVVWTGGTYCAQVTRRASRTVATDASGRIELDAYLRVIGREDVFVAGDNIYYKLPGADTPVPQVVENSIQSAQLISENLGALLTGGAMQTYMPTFQKELVSVGSRFGAGKITKGGRERYLSSFGAQFHKHWNAIKYLWQVLGWNKVISYLKKEFFTIRNGRSFLGGHFSNRTPSFVYLFLRIWMGLTWLFSGINKLLGYWGSGPVLADLMKRSGDWFNQMALDGNGIWRVRVLWHIDIFLASAQKLADSTLVDLRLKINFPLVTWLVEKLVLAGSATQMAGQWTIILLELLVGILYILGLFCTPVSVVAILLQGLMLCTIGLPMGSVWMGFAAFAMMFGGGRAMGLDYYVSPLVKKAWSAIPSVRRKYLYHD